MKSSDDAEKPRIFNFMATHPTFFLLAFPIACAALIGIGWTQEGIIEDQVTNIWIPTKGEFAKDLQYAQDLGAAESLGAASFAAMAISRDGGNLFTESRLEAIRIRMEKTEATTIEHKGITYKWEDICASAGGFPYQFPCTRLTPLDLFQEASWFFDYKDERSDPNVPAERENLYRRTWYNELIQKRLVKPRIPRFGVLTELCSTQCGAVLNYRLNPTSAGYSPFSLFADIGNLEMSDTCRICIERSFEGTIKTLHDAAVPSFTVLAFELQRFIASTNDTAAIAKATDIAQKAGQIAATITHQSVEEFYFYYVTRGAYAALGAARYQAAYPRLAPAIGLCGLHADTFGLTCPEATEVTQEVAEAAMLRHTDSGFSSVSTAGSPLPLWESSDGTGELFKGTSPVGGSGVDMSADIRSLFAYVNVTHYGQDEWSPLYGAGGFADPTSPLFTATVERNPIFSWFVAGLEDAPDGTACGDGMLPGTNTGVPQIDVLLGGLAEAVTAKWCTDYSIPNENNAGDNQPYSRQHFARMWYDRLIDSSSFLGLEEGVDDPYTWTLGQGCGYTLRGERDVYRNMTEEMILESSSRELYYIDEGESVGAISPVLLMGDATTKSGNFPNYSKEDPLTKVGVIQSLYFALRPSLIVERVKNCNRPGGPLDITEEDAEEVLFKWKQAMEESWSEGWDDESAGDVQFASFFDDTAVGGSTARMLNEITLDNSLLTAISILCIAVFSVLFLISSNWVESRVLVTLVGVTLVTIAFFAAVGFSILVGIKINVTIAWTLPFIMLGLGVDDLYIVLMAVKKQGGFTKSHFLKAMKEVIVPVSMTSIVNASMFAILNISDIPAIYLTARVADYCVVSLFIAIIFCFPAYLYLDMRRQAAGKRDIFFLFDAPAKDMDVASQENARDFRSYWLYDRFYEPLVLGDNLAFRQGSHCVIWLIAGGLFGAGIYGATQRHVGLGLEDFFPSTNQASVWAQQRTDSLASWSAAINWGALNYTDPDVQLKMIKQFENVVATPHVDKVDTKSLWMADLLLWSSTHCTANFAREEFDTLRCGADMVFEDGTTCTATWVRNKYNLRQKRFSDFHDPQCYPSEGGICRPSDRMHPADLAKLTLSGDENSDKLAGFCPVAEWSDDKFQWCLLQWRNVTGYNNFLSDEPHGSETDCEGVYNTDHGIVWPIPYSRGPSLFVYDLNTHDDTTDMIKETRAVCDNDGELHCWMSGIGHEYWSQYIGIFEVLVELSGYSTLVGFGISFIFLFATFQHDGNHPTCSIFIGSFMGALLIAVTIIASLVTVVGLSILAGVNLTGFSNMSFVLSVGFAVEYSVHIVARWLRADTSHRGIERVRYTMSFLVLPTLMSFVSSTIGVICLAFTEFEFNLIFFFRPLIIVMFSTYFYGCWWLPAMLTLLDFDVLRLGKIVISDSKQASEAPASGRAIPEQPVSRRTAPEHPIRPFKMEESIDLDALVQPERPAQPFRVEKSIDLDAFAYPGAKVAFGDAGEIDV